MGGNIVAHKMQMAIVHSTYTRRSSSGKHLQKLKPTRAALDYLGPFLPHNWQNYFTVRRAGKVWGLSIACPRCHKHPPGVVKPWNRWRWLTAHIAEEHM